MKNMKRPWALLQLLVDLDRRGHRALPFRRGNWTGNFIQSYFFHFLFHFLNSLLFFLFHLSVSEFSQFRFLSLNIVI
jgi:hypothetical protein